MSRAKNEIMRRLRLGDLRKLLRSRYGPTLPPDDAGREDLHELLLPVSLGPEAVALKMANAVKVWAPWMDHTEAEQLIDRINRMPTRERKPTARQIGKRQQVTNEQRERWKLWTIAPCNMTDVQMQEQRKAKKRDRDRQRRHRQPRQIYLANAKARTKPWEAEGISRRTWYRRRGTGTGVRQEQECHGTGVRQLKLTKAECTPVPPEKPKGRKRLSEHRRLH